MRNFNPEVHRANIRKVDRMPESEWTMVERKLRNSPSNFIPCTKNACNSKIHNAHRCWWIHPDLRPNIQKSTEPRIGSDIDNSNQKMSKELKPPLSDFRSLMKRHHDFILLQISNEDNAELNFH